MFCCRNAVQLLTTEIDTAVSTFVFVFILAASGCAGLGLGLVPTDSQPIISLTFTSIIF